MAQLHVFGRGSRRGRAGAGLVGLVGLLAAAMLLGTGSAGRAEYRAQRGDILDISVYGSPELSRRAALDLDGQISLPLIGSVPVAGLTMGEIRARLSDLLTQGKLVRTPEVVVDIAEYRPVYVKGDVFNAGAFPFRPGLTVRQVMALVGGSGGRPAGGAAAPAAASGLADLRGEYTALWTELAAQQAHLDRLRAELDGKPAIDFTVLGGRQLRPEVATRIRTLEGQQLEAVRADGQKSAEHLKTLGVFADDQLATLDLQRKEVENSVRLQADEVDKVQGLFNKGMITSTRLTDEQRALAAAKTQLLANIAQAGEVRRLRADFADKIREAGDQQRTASLKDYQQTLVSYEKTRARLLAAGQKLIASKDGLAQPQPGAGEGPSYRIFRSAGDDQTGIAASEDTDLFPGDVVEVHMPDGFGPGPAPVTASDQAGPEQPEHLAGH